MKELVYIKNASTLKLNKDRCNACGLCVKVCPHAVFKIENGKAHIARPDHCMECGACAQNCAQMAIFVNSGLGCGCATGIIEGYFNPNNENNECSCC